MRGHVGPKRAVTIPKRPVTLDRNTQLGLMFPGETEVQVFDIDDLAPAD